MAIKKIDNVFIDGKNKVFGGYIYGVDYEANFAEQPSTLKVRIINENGIYNISKEDLSFVGAVTTIKIGTKITLYMYLAGFSYNEDPSSGKILEVEYLDESVAFLDRKVVKIKDPSKIVGWSLATPTNTYDNTIILGSEDYSDIDISESDSSLTTQIYPTINPKAVLFVPPVTYTFPELLNSISSIVGTMPVLDGPTASYRRDYMGKLREVLSAWCNDIGLGFYWENRKLNFIDLRQPANINSVESLFNAIKKENSVSNFNYSYTLRDTFSRGIFGQYLKDGQAQLAASIGSDGYRNYYFSNLKLENIPWEPDIKNYVSDSGTPANKRIKAAKYGYPFFIACQITASTFRNEPITDIFDTSKIIYSKGGPVTDPTLLASITKDSGISSSSYNWISIIYDSESSMTETFRAHMLMADFYASFFYIGIPSKERARSIFGDSVVWYPQRKLVKNIPEITEAFGFLVNKIRNFSTMSLQQFLNNGSGDPGMTEAEMSKALEDKDISLDGYALKIQSADSQWSPPTNSGVVNFGDYIIIEGDSSDENFKATNSKGVVRPKFYIGRKNNPSNPIMDVSRISLPSTAPLLIQAYDTGFIQSSFPDITPKRVQTKYIPPITSNVNYYDISSFSIGENVIDQYGNFTEAFENQAQEVPQQLTPFFSSSIVVPNIDLAGSQSLSLGRGLQGMSISIGPDGVNTTYSIGTERMRLRSPDVFYRYIYDPQKKKQSVEQGWSIQISHKKFYNKPI